MYSRSSLLEGENDFAERKAIKLLDVPERRIAMPVIRLDIAIYWISIIFLLTALFFQQSEVKYLQRDVTQLQAIVKQIARVEVNNKTGEVSFAVKSSETKKTTRKDT